MPPLLSRQRQLGRVAPLDDEDLACGVQLEHKEAERHEQHGQREDEQKDQLGGCVNLFTHRLQIRLRLQPKRAKEGVNEGYTRAMQGEMVGRSHLQPKRAKEDGHEC